MGKFTPGRWVIYDGEKIYALSDDNSAVCVAELHGDNVSERHANGILIAYAPKMYEEYAGNFPPLLILVLTGCTRLFSMPGGS